MSPTPDLGAINRAQYDFLCSPLNEKRVSQLKGQSHLEAWDVRRHLIRVFGFGGFDIETKALDLIAQIEIPAQQANGRSRWTVIYRAEVRLTIKDPHGHEIAHFEDGATGDSANQPVLGDAHDHALKTALSQALKRCAVNCGDQFGLCLYNGGKAEPTVIRSLVIPDVDSAAATDLPTDDVPVQPEPALVVPEPDTTPAAAGGSEQRRQPEAARDVRKASEPQLKLLHTLFTRAEITDRDQGLQYIAMAIGHDVASSRDLTPAECSRVIDKVRSYIKQRKEGKAA